ncbi:MAG: hypothetical protein JXA89_16645 [Anaerolineae bacterium]|nr:hypothetical protein [Anaerolineae bacterium]
MKILAVSDQVVPNLREQCGPDVMIERVAQHFANRHTAHPVKRAVSAIRGLLSDPVCETVTRPTPPDVKETGE